MLQVLCVPGIGDDYAGRSIQVNEEWDPEGSEFLSQVLFPKLFLMGEEISWPGSEWECAEEQGAYYLLWTPSLRLTHWIMPCRRRERFIRSRHPLKSNRGVIPISMHAWMGMMEMTSCVHSPRGSRQNGKEWEERSISLPEQIWCDYPYSLD